MVGEIGHLDDFQRLVPPTYGGDVVSDFLAVYVLGALHCAPWTAKIEKKNRVPFIALTTKATSLTRAVIF